MIGVAARPADLALAAEFFELFKTPWEQAVRGRKYPVVLANEECAAHIDADVVIAYGSHPSKIDADAGISVARVPGTAAIESRGSRLPIYNGLATFAPVGDAHVPRCEGRAAGYSRRIGSRLVHRVGYDLFGEVGALLTDGQPQQWAMTPSLELHIDVLRQLLLQSRISFVEIPPRPHGYEFTCCLTHDIDFFGVRRHAVDRTMAGFVYRASIGTLLDVLRGRRSVGHLFKNWTAIASLPLVFVGVAPDFWHPFEDYTRAEKGLRSTYFLVPFKGRAGLSPDGQSEPSRAVRYGVDEIRGELEKAAPNSEFAVHGIDAWRDVEAGRAEIRELRTATGRAPAGVRMHWLYFDKGSPEQLEAAGFDYDSTCGYNDAVGYRAGTSQVFRLPGTQKLLELPLSIMDSALFFKRRMNLSADAASTLCREIIRNARRFGGTVVINWHDRSLAPERLSGTFYDNLIAAVNANGDAWFATAGEAVDWFRWRRAIRFNTTPSGAVQVMAPGHHASLPPAAVCVRGGSGVRYPVALRFDGSRAVEVAL